MRHANERRRDRFHTEFKVGDLVYAARSTSAFGWASAREGLCGVVIETPYQRRGTGGFYLVMVEGECHWFYPTDLEKI